MAPGPEHVQASIFFFFNVQASSAASRRPVNGSEVGKTWVMMIQRPVGPQPFSFYWKVSLFAAKKMESVSNILWMST